MYTTKDRFHRNNTCTPPATGTVCKSSHSIQQVVGPRGCRNGREPFYVCEMFWRCDIRRRENILNHFAGYFKDHSNLCYSMACITVRWNNTLIQIELTINPVQNTILRFTADEHSVESRWYCASTGVLLFWPNLNSVGYFGIVRI
jgi:hypothetical protein